MSPRAHTGAMTSLSAWPRRGAVVVCGGTAARMDGADKASIELDGVTLLERALAATVGAAEVVVVGDRLPTSRPVTWTREHPAGGGPAAGLLAGLDRFIRPPDLVAVLAVDMPLVTPATFARLEAALTAATGGQATRPGREDDPAYDGALLVDAGGRQQPLCAVYRRTALERARPAASQDEHGLPMRRLTAGMRLAEVPAVQDEALDVDTWADLRALRRRAGR